MTTPDMTKPTSATPPQSHTRRNTFITALIFAVLTIVVGLGLSLMVNGDPTTGTTNLSPANSTVTYAMIVGDMDAPTTVTIYEDFLCPACGAFEQIANNDLRDRAAAGDIKIEYRPIAFLDQASTTRYSSRAANAFAVVLHEHGAETAAKFHDILFATQPAEGTAGLTDDELIALAVNAGANIDQVQAGITGERFKQWTANATDQASRDGVTATPTVKVNGKTLKNPFDDLITTLDAAAKNN